MVPRFYQFTLLIEGIHKYICKLKFDTAPYLGVKSVHIFWIYELYTHPEGLIAAELAANSMISRSLISREIDRLRDDGYIAMSETGHGKRKNYNARITLTESGKALAKAILEEAIQVQTAVSKGVSDEELAVFYVTLRKLHDNIRIVAKERESDSRQQVNV